MRKVTQKFIMMLFVAVSALFVACDSDDNLESITLKRSGGLSITVLNGEEPLVNQKVRFYNYLTESEIDVLLTDENGVIDFGKLNDGIYGVSIEILAPKYYEIFQEIQVLSGESINKTIQLQD